MGELEQLEKDLEKRRAPCVRVDGGGGRAATGVATPLLSGAARYLLWPPPRRRRRDGLRALQKPVRACVRARNIIAALGYVAESQRTLTLI